MHKSSQKETSVGFQNRNEDHADAGSKYDYVDNREIHRRLADEIISRLGWRKSKSAEILVLPLKINNFSICFAIDVRDSSKANGVYVKIPKADLFKKTRMDIMPFSDADREFAWAEYQSLTHLAAHWNSSDLNVTFVKPLYFIEEYNAIVTARVYANPFFRVFRRCNIQRSLGGQDIDVATESLARLGIALSRFHKTSIRAGAFDSEKTFARIKHYSSEMSRSGVSDEFCNQIVNTIASSKEPFSTSYVNTLKGLDIRNILIDQSDNMFLLDPGNMKEDCLEGDLARFLVTCKILYWGSPMFFSGLSPDGAYAGSFLGGYYGENRISKNPLLDILIVKELVKHWQMAYTVLRLKPWPYPLKRFMRSTYIDSFYKREIGKALVELEG